MLRSLIFSLFLSLFFSCAIQEVRGPSSVVACSDEIKSFLNKNSALENKLSSMIIRPGRKIIKDGENDVFLLTLEDGTRALFKPHAERTNNIYSEVTAFRVSSFFNIDLAPVVVLRNYSGREGSLQEFIEDARDGHLVMSSPRKEDKSKQTILDYLILNLDRMGNKNYLLTPEGRLYSIDHGRAFYNFMNPFLEKKAAEIAKMLSVNQNFSSIREKVMNASFDELMFILKDLNEEQRAGFFERLKLLKDEISRL